MLTLASNTSLVQTGYGYVQLRDSGSTGDGIVNQGTIIAADASGYLQITGNSFANQGTLAVSNGAAMDIGSTTIANSGIVTVSSAGSLTVSPGGTFINTGSVVASGGSITLSGTLNNTGLLDATAGGTLAVGGTLRQLSGTTLTGGTLEADAGSTLTLPNSRTIATDSGTIILSGTNSVIESYNTATQRNVLLDFHPEQHRRGRAARAACRAQLH